MNLSTILTGPLTEALNKVIPDENKRAEAREAIHQALIQSEDKALEHMSSTMAADAASGGWLTRNARPAVVVWALSLISYVAVTKDFTVLDTLVKIPQPLWDMITLGTGMYIASRGIEKVVTTAVKGLKK